MSNHFALIIEDDSSLATIFSEAVRTAGYDLEVISDGNSALKRLAEIVPDLIVLDLHLPMVSGVEILQNIRADTRLNTSKVIVSTADVRKAEELENEATLVLVKPVRFSQLRTLAMRLKES